MTETANTTLRQVHILGIEATDKRHPEGETHSASRYVATLAIVPPIEREVLQADMDEVRMTLSRQGTSPINPRIMGSRPVMLPTRGGEEVGEVKATVVEILDENVKGFFAIHPDGDTDGAREQWIEGNKAQQWERAEFVASTLGNAINRYISDDARQKHQAFLRRVTLARPDSSEGVIPG